MTSSGADEETVSTLRQRLKTMKEMFGDEVDTTDTAKRKKAAKRRNGNCIDNLIDGSFMGFVLAMCLTMVLGAAFFAFKNLYFAVSKKIWVDRSELWLFEFLCQKSINLCMLNKDAKNPF